MTPDLTPANYPAEPDPVDLDALPWTCPCGHEIDPATRFCVVWTGPRESHLVPHNEHVCRCHGRDLRGHV